MRSYASHELEAGIIAHLLVPAIIINVPLQHGCSQHLCSRMGLSPTLSAQEDLELGIYRNV